MGYLLHPAPSKLETRDLLLQQECCADAVLCDFLFSLRAQDAAVVRGKETFVVVHREHSVQK